MNRANKLQNEKEKYKRFYNVVIIITFLILISLLVLIPSTFEMLGIDTKYELQVNTIKQETIEKSKSDFIDKQNNKSVFEPEYYVVVKKIAEENEINIKSDENLLYPNLQLNADSDTTKYTLVYVNDDGKVIRAENIKGLVWNFKEYAEEEPEKTTP